jgi:hypothetical protein
MSEVIATINHRIELPTTDAKEWYVRFHYISAPAHGCVVFQTTDFSQTHAIYMRTSLCKSPRHTTTVLEMLVADKRIATARTSRFSTTDDANINVHTVIPAISATKQHPTRFTTFDRAGTNKATLTFFRMSVSRACPRVALRYCNHSHSRPHLGTFNHAYADADAGKQGGTKRSQGFYCRRR